MKTIALALSIAATIVTPVQAKEELRLTDGRTIILNDDGTYAWPTTERALSVRLVAVGQASGFMADPRDCGLSFELSNEMGGTILALKMDITVVDKSGVKLMHGGVIDYEIDMFSFREQPIPAGASHLETINVAAPCESLGRLSLGAMPEKYCNYVGRRASDTCRDLVRVESDVPALPFTK